MGTWATQRLDALIAGAELPPVIKTMQLGGLDAWGEGWASKTWTPSAELLHPDGSMFGGTIAALADQMLAFAAMTVVPGDSSFRTTNLTVSFFKLGKGETLNIRGEVIAQSRQLIHVRARFSTTEGSLVAEASAQQLVKAFG